MLCTGDLTGVPREVKKINDFSKRKIAQNSKY
jgi:hypothetical protein